MNVDDQSLIEQDHDSMDRIWLDDCSWLNNSSTAPKRNDRDQEGFLGWVNKNTISINILTFVIGGIIFYIIGSIML